MSEEIRRAIGERRQRNKEHRNLETEEGREEAWNRNISQKVKVKEMIREQIRKHEQKITEEIKAEGRGKKLWDHINKLKGEKARDRRLIQHNEKDERMEMEDAEKEIRNYWKDIYCMHENKIRTVWTRQIRE